VPRGFLTTEGSRERAHGPLDSRVAASGSTGVLGESESSLVSSLGTLGRRVVEVAAPPHEQVRLASPQAWQSTGGRPFFLISKRGRSEWVQWEERWPLMQA
jgi:hypothetical protein